MNNSFKKNTASTESYHWLWYVQEDRFQLPRPFSSRYLTGLNGNTVSLKDWCLLFIQNDKDYIQDQLLRFKHGNGESTLSFSGYIKDATGERVKARCSGQAVDFKDGRPTLVSGQIELDYIRHQLESTSHNDSYLLNQIMQGFPYSIFFKDLQSRFTKISTACASKFGLNHPNDAIGKTDFDFFDDSHATEAYRDEQQIIKTGKPILDKREKEVTSGSAPTTLWASTAKLPLYDYENNIIGTFGITKDITEQIRADEALKESEGKYRSIFENIYDVYYRTNRHGIVTEISPSVETFSGHKRKDVIGHPVSNFYYYQTDREKLIESLKKDRVVSDFEVRMANAKDKLMYASVSAKIVTDDSGGLIAVEGIMRDITERKLTELKLKKTHNFFDQILNNTSEGIYVINSNYEYIYWNSMMETISGMTQDQVLGKNPFELFPHVNHEKLTHKLKKAMSGQTVKSADYYFEIESSGNKGWAHAYYTPLRSEDGNVDNVLVAISDISERKQAEEKLRKSDETLKKLSQQVPGAIYQFQQFPDGSSCFPFASEAFNNVYELKPKEVLHDSKKAIDRIHPEDLKSVAATINKSFNTLEPWEHDYRVQLPERGLRWLRGRARPERQEDGSVIWHGYLTDITEKKQQENELNETLNIVSDQNTRLLNFAHIVSHNLRNHAGNISALLSLIETETSEEEKVQLFNYLNMASTRLNEAIKDLNDIIDQQAGSSKNISDVNIFEFFSKIREILATDIIVHNVKFDTDICDDSTIQYNPAYLESILLNLISNAIKYRHSERDPLITLSFKQTDMGPLLIIRDNGQGIDLEKHRQSLFGMYKTFHENEDSKGIGLYITKNQVVSMGGSIDVDSEVGKGTTFKILLACDLSRIKQESR
ncbi:PAS domain-containing protein [Rhodohalobacter sp. 8-1]|uniref:PAS domain-containing protein n=1 Tax=Rhodohalobacter sp. 8-1 TaxID=3131972 RepID=UPI0030EDE2AB